MEESYGVKNAFFNYLTFLFPGNVTFQKYFLYAQ